MERETVSRKELISILNNELGDYEECNKCQFTSVMVLREYDSNGCNWSSAILRCGGQEVKLCRPIADGIIDKIKALYNITK